MQIRFDKVSYFPSDVNIDGICAVEDLSFEIGRPGLTGIMGDADSGKNTVLFLLSGLLRPRKGHILIDDQDICSKSYIRNTSKVRSAFIMREAGKLFYEKTVEREFNTVLRCFKLSDEEKQKRIASALCSVGLDMEDVIQTAPGALTKCDRYKLSIALSLVTKPDILLLDEPMTQLDSKGREMLLILLEKLKAEDCCVIIASNDADLLSEHADTVLVLQKGRLIRSGSAKDVFVNYYDLIRNHIPVPKVKKTAQMLRERDVNMPSNVVEYEQFIDRLKIIMWRKQR